jgi:hypothetical protein
VTAEDRGRGHQDRAASLAWGRGFVGLGVFPGEQVGEDDGHGRGVVVAVATGLGRGCREQLLLLPEGPAPVMRIQVRGRRFSKTFSVSM